MTSTLLMKNARNVSKKVKDLSLFFIMMLIVSFLLSLVLSGESLILIFYTEGQGIVVDRMNKSGAGSGLWIKVTDGTETRIPPSLWNNVHRGDFLLKKRFSFFYQINEETYNAFLYMVKVLLIVWGILFVLYVIGLLYNGAQER